MSLWGVVSLEGLHIGLACTASLTLAGRTGRTSSGIGRDVRELGVGRDVRDPVRFSVR